MHPIPALSFCQVGPPPVTVALTVSPEATDQSFGQLLSFSWSRSDGSPTVTGTVNGSGNELGSGTSIGTGDPGTITYTPTSTTDYPNGPYQFWVVVDGITSNTVEIHTHQVTLGGDGSTYTTGDGFNVNWTISTGSTNTGHVLVLLNGGYFTEVTGISNGYTFTGQTTAGTRLAIRAMATSTWMNPLGRR